MKITKSIASLSIKKILPIFFISFLGVATILLTINAVKNRGKLTDFEYQNFVEQSTAIMNFYEELDCDCEANSYEAQIPYAIETLYARDGRDKYSLDEIQSLLNSSLVNTANLSELAQNNYELSIYDKNIFYDTENQSFSLHRELLSHKQVMNKTITKYILVDVKKHKNTYTATYDKYTFDEPYQIISRTSQDDTVGKHSIKDYLDGNGTSLALKELLNENNIKDIKEPDSQITLEFEFIDNQLKLNNQ